MLIEGCGTRQQRITQSLHSDKARKALSRIRKIPEACPVVFALRSPIITQAPNPVPTSRDLLTQAVERGEPLGRTVNTLTDLLAHYGVAELTASGAGYLAVCKSDPEFQMAAERAPNGLAARLIAGERPAALKVVSADADVLVLQPAADAMVTGSLPDRPSVLGLRPSLDP